MKGLKVFGHIVAGFFSIIFCFCLMVMGVLTFALSFFSADYFSNILKEINLNEIKISDLGIEGIDTDYSEDATLEDLVVDSLEEAGLENEEAKVIVNNDDIKEVLGEFISETVEYTVTQEKIPQIDSNEVLKIMNTEEIVDILEERPSDAEIIELVDELNLELKKFFMEEFDNAEGNN